ncbi:hypothetical protein X798_01625 [Onchocerca flexuosa]|uniref:Uncharacterized protein n=1 Tax=Onchocerca flexuosa TaxID=387005 RepID=A0A238C169_9BILA|nr:hypothetical protein X798_01625 [Onchocerca flexuosa]
MQLERIINGFLAIWSFEIITMETVVFASVQLRTTRVPGFGRFDVIEEMAMLWRIGYIFLLPVSIYSSTSIVTKRNVISPFMGNVLLDTVADVNY